MINVEKIENRAAELIRAKAGRPGVVRLREKLNAYIDGLRERYPLRPRDINGNYIPGVKEALTREQCHDIRLERWAETQRQAEKGRQWGMALPLICGAWSDADEHGSWSSGSDKFSGRLLDLVEFPASQEFPFLDHGGAGLGVIEVTRWRTYSKSYHRHYGGPRPVSSRYLVGKNEIGTFFAHAVNGCATVKMALAWIWRGQEVLRRQGDIAIVTRRGGAGSELLPEGHDLRSDGMIYHATHHPIAGPRKGERIIVGRRAVPHSARQSRD